MVVFDSLEILGIVATKFRNKSAAHSAITKGITARILQCIVIVVVSDLKNNVGVYLLSCRQLNQSIIILISNLSLEQNLKLFLVDLA